MNVDVNELETDKLMLPYEECDMTHGRTIYVIIKNMACKLIKYVIFILALALIKIYNCNFTSTITLKDLHHWQHLHFKAYIIFKYHSVYSALLVQ